MFPDIQMQNYIKHRSIDVSVDLRVQTGSAKFSHISMHLSKFETRYVRVYLKLQEVIASIGGIFSAVLILSQFVVGFVSRRLFLIRLANDSYIHKKKDKKRQTVEKNYSIKDIPEEGKASMMMTSMKSPLGKFIQETEIMKNDTENLSPSPNKIIEMKDITTENNKNLEQSEEKKPKITNNFYKNPINDKYNLIEIVDEKGKIKASFKNIFFPNNGLKKIYEIMDKKSGIDEMMSYCTQVEKIKKYMFDKEEEMQIFNYLPDLDLVDIIPQAREQRIC